MAAPSPADLADLFPGFKAHTVETADGRFFVRSGGRGAPILLLHGYPQTHVEWHKVAGRLAERFTVVAMDLRGYGASFVPPSHSGDGMTKRLMGRDAVEVMHKLGFERFRILGHDRGGRVAYRLAFDQPDRLEQVAVIDIIPTASMFRGMNRPKNALKAYHWLFLAQPEPFPETMIGVAASAYLEHTLASWSAKKDLSVFHPDALEHYRRAFADPARIHASCEDYRAGVEIDRLQDEDDLKAGRKITVPMLAIWGEGGIPASGVSVLDVWREFARDVSGVAVPSGHFVPEENPKACVDALLDFFEG